ncbi:PQQ-binding-like beta-propeller repeat protein [Comamonas sp. JC664]|uniref:PQQ-binding-like beta-propeller repeat protein n=1 Tax=Comamonas sp. JC664 TaxID=2801917 RepID=UPI00174B9EB7|nr:PQQ-binding-like beta-propeller repeat protein [Comamonas sp. JC664]MBL0692486.1 PQQ-binding-like beta-propeller repeat protein [Comamonas sp. JC664]GHH01468.1 hypothetical protein GCM10012319_69230 [Comamonas sp. KCTC 72670]
MLRKPLLSLLLGASVLSAACSDSDDPKPDPAVLIIDRDEVDFGEQDVGLASPEHVFTVRNASPSAVESISVKVEGSGFTISASTCERFLDAGRECEVRVRFMPQLAGPNEALLHVEGAPEVDRAVLKGVGVGHVVVQSVSGAGVRVVVEGQDVSCDGPCRVPVRAARVTLRTDPAGFADWIGECTVVPGAGCSLVMNGTKVVALREFAPLVRWELRRDSHPRSVAVLPGGDILVLEAEQLLRLSGTGDLRWAVSMSHSRKMALDGEGNIYVLEISGWVVRYEPDGRLQWRSQWPGAPSLGQDLAVSASGHVYALVVQNPHPLSQQLKLIALSAQGTERWSLTFNEGAINTSHGLAVDAQGEVYLSGSVFNTNATTGEWTHVKSYFRKYSPEGSLRWETADGGSLFAVNAEGATSTLMRDFLPSGLSWVQRWMGANGQTQWTEPLPASPGMVTLQAFSSPGTLLVGGHEDALGTTAVGRGWFFVLNLPSRAPGPVTYVEERPGMGGPVVISGLALTPAGHVVVAGGFGSHQDAGDGYIRMYDRRVLTDVP